MNPVSNSFFIIFFVFLVGIQKNAFCQDNDPKQVIENYIAEYGKQPLIDVILDIRASIITITQNGTLINAFGRPRKDFITAETILTDIDKAGLDITTFSERLENYLIETHQKHERVKKSNASDDYSMDVDKPAKITTYDERKACRNDCQDEFYKCRDKITARQEKCSGSGASQGHCESIFESSENMCKENRLSCRAKCKYDKD